jgi:hypothetical protein
MDQANPQADQGVRSTETRPLKELPRTYPDKSGTPDSPTCWGRFRPWCCPHGHVNHLENTQASLELRTPQLVGGVFVPGAAHMGMSTPSKIPRQVWNSGLPNLLGAFSSLVLPTWACQLLRKGPWIRARARSRARPPSPQQRRSGSGANPP